MAVPVGPVVFKCKINGVFMRDLSLDFEYRAGWGKHDLFIIRIAAMRNHPYKTRLAAYPDGATVEILWGRTPDALLTWYGYINHHEQTSETHEGTITPQISYVCIGTSRVLNSDRNRLWKHITAPGIAMQIARENKMRAVVTGTNWILESEQQGSMSDFNFLNRIASKVGYRFWMSGGTLYFVHPKVWLAGNNDFIPVYHIDQNEGWKDTASHFKLLQGDNIPGGEIINRHMFGIDRWTGKTFDARADTGMEPDLDFFETHQLVNDWQDAKRRINAQQNLSQFWLRATVRVTGWSLLYPGKGINLWGNAFPDNCQGNWIVTGARHKLRQNGLVDVQDRYVTELEIIKDTKNYTPSMLTTQIIKPEQVICTLSGNRWQSTNFSAVSNGWVNV